MKMFYIRTLTGAAKCDKHDVMTMGRNFYGDTSCRNAAVDNFLKLHHPGFERLSDGHYEAPNMHRVEAFNPAQDRFVTVWIRALHHDELAKYVAKIAEGLEASHA